MARLRFGSMDSGIECSADLAEGFRALARECAPILGELLEVAADGLCEEARNLWPIRHVKPRAEGHSRNRLYSEFAFNGSEMYAEVVSPAKYTIYIMPIRGPIAGHNPWSYLVREPAKPLARELRMAGGAELIDLWGKSLK